MKQVMFKQTVFLVFALIFGLTASPVAFAVQYARPDGSSSTLWEIVNGSTVHGVLDEASPGDDGDYIDTGINSSAATLTLSLSNASDPGSYADNHTLRIRDRSDASGGGPEKYDIVLRIAGGATIWSQSNIAAFRHASNFDLNTYPIADFSAAAGNYDNLEIEISIAALDSDETIQISWVELEVPDAASTPPVVSSPTFTNVASLTADLGGTVDTDGTPAADQQGTVWNDTGVTPVTENPLDQGTPTIGVAFSHQRTLPSASQIFFSAFARQSTTYTYSSVASFYTEPNEAPTTVTFPAVGSTTMTISWTASTEPGAGSIVIVSEADIIAPPVDGTTYTANTQFLLGDTTAAGDYVVYNSTGSSVSITDLTASTTYYVAVYSYSGTGAGASGVRYLNTAATGTQTTAAASTPPTLTPTPTFNTVGPTSAVLGGTVLTAGVPAAEQQGTVWNHTGVTPVTENPLDQGAPTLTVPFEHSRTGMNSADQVFFSAFARQSTTYTYSDVASFYTYPANDPTIGAFSGIGASSMTINWTPSTESGDSGGSIVVVSTVDSTITAPVDGTLYTPDAVAPFNEPTTGGGNDYVVYEGTGSSVTISGLTENLTYYVAIYSASGSGAGLSGVRYKTPTTATGSQKAVDPPVVNTTTIATVTNNSAFLGADTVTGTDISAKGTVWKITTGVTDADDPLSFGTGTGGFSHQRTGMLSADQIFFKAYATNPAGTTLSAEDSFYTYPANQASNVTFSNIGATSMTINWTPTAEGRESGSIVVVSTVDSTITAPVDGTVYAVSAVAPFGDPTVGAGDDFVVYESTGASVTISNLTESVRYYVAVFSYSGSGPNDQGVRYLTPTSATGDEITVAASDEPTVQASNIVIETVASKALRFHWTPGNGDGSLVTIRDDGVTAVPPVDSTDYAAESDLSATPPPPTTGTGNFVVYKGTGDLVTVNGLTAGNTYIITVYAWGGSAVSPDYLPTIDTTPTTGNEVTRTTDGPAMHNYNNAADCSDCHSNHGNAGLVPRDANQTAVCETCHNVDHPSAASGKLDFALHLTPKYGDVDPDCGSCHEVHNPNGNTTSTHTITPFTVAENQSFIRSNVDKYVSTATSDDNAVYQTKDDDLAIEGGDASTARGICQSCHTQTTFHQFGGGTVASQCHKGGSNDTCSGEVVCTDCHVHSDNFSGAGGDCTACHNSAQDDGTELATKGAGNTGAYDGRREIVSEFSPPGQSTHILGTSLVAADCEICHAQTTLSPLHEHGFSGTDKKVTLWDADNHSSVYQLGFYGEPTTSSTEADNLEPFCLSCHDSNGADWLTSNGDATHTASSPFTDSIAPPDIDATWLSSSHGNVTQREIQTGDPLTCFGDGTSFGCHGSGHGSLKLDILAPADTDGGANNSGSLEGFCLNCHDSDGPSNINIDQFFGELVTDFQETGNNGSGAPINQKHDILPTDQTYSGAVVTCKDCHEPHIANNANPNKDPDTGSMFTNSYNKGNSYTNDGSTYLGTTWTYDSSGAALTNLDPTDPLGGTAYSEPDYIEFCLTCHDGTTPPGVTMSIDMLNIATTYQTDYHGAGDAGSAGNGDFKPPWVVTQGDEPGTPYAAMNCTLCHTSHGSGNIYHLRESITIGNSPAQEVGGWTGDTIGTLSGTSYTLPLDGGVQVDHDWGGWCSFCHNMQPHKVDETKACRSGHMHGGGAF